MPPEMKLKLKAVATLKETTMGAVLRELIGDALDKKYEECVK